MVSDPIKICYFPGREATYMRTRVILKAIEESGMILFDCSHPKKSFFRYFSGFVKFLKYKSQADIVFVGFLGQHLMPLVKLFTRKKIVFDAFLSVYQTLAFDRKQIKADGFIAKIVRWLEKWSCDLSDVIVFDTQQHIDYFVGLYGVERKKCHRLLVGCDDSLLTQSMQSPSDSDQFLVHFHGEYQPVHGAQFIVEAAKLLPDISFQMIGNGQGKSECVAKAKIHQLKNIHFTDTLAYDQLIKKMAKASLCLGLLGDTEKAQLAIPIKVYEALAMGKAVITADTPAARELLTHKDNAYLCQAGNPQSIAEAIEELCNNKALRDHIAENGKKLFERRCSPQVIGNDLKNIIQEVTLEA